MRIKQLCLLAFCTILGTQAMAGFVVNVSLAGKPANDTLYFSYEEGGKKVNDSVLIKDGKATFKGNVASPVFAFLRFKNVWPGVGFFLENGPVTITSTTGALADATVKAGKEQVIYTQWQATWKTITSQAGVYYRMLDSSGKANKKPGDDPRNPTVDSVTRKITSDGFASLSVRTDTAVEGLIKRYPQSSVAAFVIEDRYINYLNIPQAEKCFAMLGDKAKQSNYGKAITEFMKVQAKTAMGVKPEFSMEDSTGKMVTLASFKGKYVLVDFWASWCGPCRKENPNVKAAFAKYRGKGFEVVGASLDTKKDAWLAAVEKDGLTWTQLSDLKGWQSPAVEYFGIKGIPFNFLVDRDGKVVGKNLRGEELEAVLAKYLGK